MYTEKIRNHYYSKYRFPKSILIETIIFLAFVTLCVLYNDLFVLICI